MIPKTLTSADVGAPTLNDNDGSLISVLDWALVDSPDALGWTRPFTNTATKGVYRNNNLTGSGGYLRVLDAAADHGANGRLASVQSYTSMSDIDTGTDVSPDSGELFWAKSNSTDGSPRDWIIIGTDKWFWWMPFPAPNPADGHGYLVYACGDPAGTYGDDPFPFMLIANPSGNPSSSTSIGGLQTVTSGNPSSNQIAIKAWNTSYAAGSGSIDAGMQVHPYGGSTLAGTPGGSWLPPWPNPPNAIPTSKIAASELAVTATEIFMRGILPGVLCPLVNIQLTAQSTWTDGDGVAGVSNGSELVTAIYRPVNRTLLFNTGSVTGALLFDVSTDWDNW